MTASQKHPGLYLSMPHPCSYLPERESTILFVDPQQSLDSEHYGHFVQQGFRRSGDLIYRPYCRACAACVAVRLPVNDFTPDRSQRRVARANADLAVTLRAPGFDEEHFALYRRYQSGRHPGSGMDDPDPDKYQRFLSSSLLDTRFIEFRLDGRLLAVAIADWLPDGLSAVYTFYDPAEQHRGLGTYAILREIEEVRRLGLPHLYLGYWIAESRKMAYKRRFRPIEALTGRRWERMADQ
jgi:arginine-tRNA-protein transferase